MTITIHAQGAERKRLVQTISDWLGVPAKYCGAPTFNYEVDYFTIDRNGSLSFDDRADSEVIERLLEHLYDEGFDIDQSHTDDGDEPCAVCVSMPRSLFTDSNLENLKALTTAKGSLIKKALGVSDLPLEITDAKVSFPWFPATPTPDEMKAYDTITHMVLTSQINEAEKMYICMLNPMSNRTPAIGLLSGIGSTPFFAPIALKALISKEPLDETERLLNTIKLDKDDYHLLRYYNMMVINRPASLFLQ